MLLKTHSHACAFIRSSLISVVLAAFLSGCGSAISSDDPFSELQVDAGQPVLSPTLPEDSTLAAAAAAPVVVGANGTDSLIATSLAPDSSLPFDDPTDLDHVGPITTLANTGLQVGLAGELDVARVDMSLIEGSWTHMQTCLAVVAVAPLVIVTEDAIRPFSGSDDILYHLDGSMTASLTRYASGATLQISLADLDGSLNQVGFNLRSIMGRYLWTSAGLPERDYPHNCASLR